MREEPIDELTFHLNRTNDGAIFDASTKNVEQLRKGGRQFHVLYILTANVKQLTEGSLVIALTAKPLQQNESGANNSRGTDCHVIAETLEFASKAQQGFGSSEENLNGPPVSALNRGVCKWE